MGSGRCIPPSPWRLGDSARIFILGNLARPLFVCARWRVLVSGAVCCLLTPTTRTRAEFHFAYSHLTPTLPATTPQEAERAAVLASPPLLLLLLLRQEESSRTSTTHTRTRATRPRPPYTHPQHVLLLPLLLARRGPLDRRGKGLPPWRRRPALRWRRPAYSYYCSSNRERQRHGPTAPTSH